jgi:SpoIID/LytB domain protein
VLGAAVVAGLALTPVASLGRAAAATHAEVYPVPPGGVFTFHGRGYGHGHGMSQWGAYGAAKVDHLSSNQILHFYFPHTTLATRSTNRTIRVLLTSVDAPGAGYLQVAPAAGLSETPAGGKTKVLPAKAGKKPITAWRLRKSGSVIHLRDEVAGAWHMYATVGSRATLAASAAKIRLTGPGQAVTYRGAVTGEIESGVLQAVNVVNLEQYIQSVVPAEMPSSWPMASLQAQAVASRTYARRELNNPKSGWFDLYGDTRDQAYLGAGDETARTTRAVAATAGETIVDSANQAILAQYSSSNGGWTVSGGVSYLPSRQDPYDGAIPNDAHAWTTSVSASSLASAYPQLGSLQEIKITGRNGDGLWGGRVATLDLVGSKATVALSGIDLQLALGLRSYWFRPTPTPAAPVSVKATVSGTSVTATWKLPAHISGQARVTGYRLTVGAKHVSVGASARTATVTKLAKGTYTATVVALSAAGPGPAASAKVTVG